MHSLAPASIFEGKASESNGTAATGANASAPPAPPAAPAGAPESKSDTAPASKSGSTDEGHGTLGGADEAHEGDAYLVLVFLSGCLVIGSCITMVQKRTLKSVPYTCLLFVAGLLLAVVHHYKPRDHALTWQAWYKSVDQWQGISPHLLFFVFLPVLIFGDAFKMNGHLVKRMLGRILLLAGPGVLIGTILTGVFTYYVLPYGWDWSFCLLLGAILSATDPVAVVSLFETLGVPAELTMLISGESLLNDGTAIVVFALMLKAVKGETVTCFGSIAFFLTMTVLAVILGIIIAFIAEVGISVCCKGDSESDPFIQVVITICCAYVCFLFAEHEVGTSGVLTLVTAGIFLSKSVWPMFVNRHVINVVWETLEFIANTVIFMLAGLLLGGEVLSNHSHIEWADLFYLCCFYLALTIIRAIMVGLFWYPLKSMGSDLSASELVVMVWSGLRGAIGIVMAIIVQTDPAVDKQKGSKVIFYVGGIAALTILINAVTCGPLLSFLGLTAETAIAARRKEHYQTHLSKLATELLRNQQIGVDTRFKGVDVHLVKAMMTHEFPEVQQVGRPSTGKEHIGFCREMFLEMVKHNYWQDISTEIIPKNSAVAQILLDSASECLLTPDRPLADWICIEKALTNNVVWCPCMADLVRGQWASQFADLLETFPSSELVQLQNVYASLCFQEAHRKARQTINEQEFFHADQSIEYVMKESEDQISMAERYLQTVPLTVVATGKAKMLARFLLNAQRSKIKHLEQLGMLTGREVEHFTHAIKASQSNILSDREPEDVRKILAKPAKEPSVRRV